jgi:hypothetical protein
VYHLLLKNARQKICAACSKLDRVKQIDCTHVKTTTHYLSPQKCSELKLLHEASSPEDIIHELCSAACGDDTVEIKDQITKKFKRERVSNG